MELFLVILTLLLGGVLALVSLWAWFGSSARAAEEELSSPQRSSTVDNDPPGRAQASGESGKGTTPEADPDIPAVHTPSGVKEDSVVGDHRLQQNTEVDAEFKLTKCVTIQTQDRSELSDKWMQYVHVLSGQAQCLSDCKKSDWQLPDKGHVLLHIDIPNQQVYPLPLLITPVHCVYLITFDLPEGDKEEKALKAIHDTLQDVYAYSKGHDEDVKPEVFLVGLQKEEKDRSSFAQRLKQMLKMRAYQKLLVHPEGDNPYWTNLGAELSIQKIAVLLRKNQRNSCLPTQPSYKSLAHHCELHQRFKDGDPFPLYEEVKAKMADAVSGVSSNFEEFLSVLHRFGLIFYCSLPNLAESKRVVVLQPQNLCRLFVQLQQLRKRRNLSTIADLLKTTTIDIGKGKEWFQAMCIDKGLVIKHCITETPSYVFVMGLDLKCALPERAHLSVDPLLVTYWPPDFEERPDDYFLPSSLFPAFINTFLKKLKEKHKTKKRPIAMKRHYLHVVAPYAAQIHVIERDSFIEIGLQHFHVSEDLEEGKLLDRLRQSCQDVYDIVSKSAESATANLGLESSNLRYGFLGHSECNDPKDRFGKFEEGTLTCSYCNGPQAPTPQQQIWFSEVDHKKVRVERVTFQNVGCGKRIIRKLVAGSVPALLPQSPLAQSPVAPLPQAPVSPLPQAPVAPLPQAPVAPLPQAAVAPLPQAPVAPLPQAPVAPLPQAPVAQAQLGPLSQAVTDRSDHLMLFRQYVSRTAADNGRAVLEGVELDTHTIKTCFQNHQMNVEEAVQDGLTKWEGGEGRQPPTWQVLIKAMEYAGIAQQHIQSMKEKLDV